MGIAEGVETALAAMQMTGMTVWASLGAARLDKIWLPPIVRKPTFSVMTTRPAGRHPIAPRWCMLRSAELWCRVFRPTDLKITTIYLILLRTRRSRPSDCQGGRMSANHDRCRGNEHRTWRAHR